MSEQTATEPVHSSQTDASAGRKFQAEANKGRISLPREFLDFLMHNKKWWLTPIILFLLLLGGLLLIGSAAPFIYTLF